MLVRPRNAKVRKFFLFLLLGVLVSCASNAKSSLVHVFLYQDFGPPVIANELIGMDWWQWQSHGEPVPQNYDIKVIVYQGIDLQILKKRYPVVPEKEKDFRYVSYDDAVQYLDKHIDDNVLEATTKTLKATRQRITN